MGGRRRRIIAVVVHPLLLRLLLLLQRLHFVLAIRVELALHQRVVVHVPVLLDERLDSIVFALCMGARLCNV